MRSIVLQVLIAGAATSLAFAAPATADSGEYLHALQPFYPTLSAETLLSVGSKVCSAIQSGSNSTDALQMVQDQIGVSTPAAGDIVSAAVVHLDC
ncbi:MAG: hypothetical protein QOD36_3311 [Mycobacterium sp.]|jgi:hypothetical protein|nr:hypothetical protein [Mycobacterium sp.]MDT5245935.1 hypothetical protein [Mycobacterium sp.]MDT5330041.1 hypothetical protein [Mycobacterium sp.]